MADTKKKQLTDGEDVILAFIQQPWESSHDWTYVFQKLEQEYHVHVPDVWTMMEFCAAYGYLRVLELLRSSLSLEASSFPDGTPCWPDRLGSWACARAAENGHPEVLEYLYEAQAPFGLFQVVHNNCKEFIEIYGESWKSKRFDVLLPWQCMKPAKNAV